MNTTVETIQKYIKENYNLDFKLYYIGTHREIKYIKNKVEYNFMCDYAQSNPDDPYTEYWSIYDDYMDYKNWYGFGSARVDKGIETIDEIMADWGFKKEKQMSIFDMLGDDINE